jgi:hypothetical protein
MLPKLRATKQRPAIKEVKLPSTGAAKALWKTFAAITGVPLAIVSRTKSWAINHTFVGLSASPPKNSRLLSLAFLVLDLGSVALAFKLDGANNSELRRSLPKQASIRRQQRSRSALSCRRYNRKKDAAKVMRFFNQLRGGANLARQHPAVARMCRLSLAVKFWRAMGLLARTQPTISALFYGIREAGPGTRSTFRRSKRPAYRFLVRAPGDISHLYQATRRRCLYSSSISAFLPDRDHGINKGTCFNLICADPACVGELLRRCR